MGQYFVFFTNVFIFNRQYNKSKLQLLFTSSLLIILTKRGKGLVGLKAPG